MPTLSRLLAGLCVLGLIFQVSVAVASLQQKIQQPREGIEAYRVCEQFEKTLGETLDFGLAYEATFTKDAARRREIAIADGEFRDVDLSKVDDASLITAYKSRMQMIYLTLILASPDTDEQAQLYFPPAIKRLMASDPPSDPKDFPGYAAQLARGAKDFRAHLDQLATKYPDVAKRIRDFKNDLSQKKTLPDNYRVEPQHGRYRGEVLQPNESYYDIEGYTVIRENNEMRLIGIRFFTRLF